MLRPLCSTVFSVQSPVSVPIDSTTDPITPFSSNVPSAFTRPTVVHNGSAAARAR